MSTPSIISEVRAAEGGHCGPDNRSDIHVRVEPRESDGIEITLESRVEAYYGEAILAQARQVLKDLHVDHARVAIHDEGALPFVISARIEACAKRAGLGRGYRALPERLADPPLSARDQMRRSRLYIPGNEPKYFVNAGLRHPDGVILDLEDSVHSREKDAARLLVRNALRAVDFGPCERMVRINQLPLGLADLEEIVPEIPNLILVPKVERPERVLQVIDQIERVKDRHGIDRPIWIMPILESALGIENAYAIATASADIVAMTIGLEDYTADLGVAKTATGAESLFARQRLVNAARAAGIQAIDSVYGDVADLEGLQHWGVNARAMGFEGMGCIHPLQIEIIHQAFAPTAAEIEKALRIVEAFEEAQKKGLSVVSLGSKMIDPPVVQRALKLVNRAKRIAQTT